MNRKGYTKSFLLKGQKKKDTNNAPHFSKFLLQKLNRMFFLQYRNGPVVCDRTKSKK